MELEQEIVALKESEQNSFLSEEITHNKLFKVTGKKREEGINKNKAKKYLSTATKFVFARSFSVFKNTSLGATKGTKRRGKGLTSLNNDDDAVQYLSEHEWDLEKTVEAVLSSKNDDQLTLADLDVEVEIEAEANGGQEGNDNASHSPKSISIQEKTLILLLLPDNTAHTFDMKASDTLWDLYARVLQSSPQLSQKNFTFVLQDGQKLQEREFDQTLENCSCVPQGSVQVFFVATISAEIYFRVKQIIVMAKCIKSYSALQ
ncbi:hypothetical protein RFI_07062 [Reticulomyxa filosa]|uniref:Ubiquitin-like domain-containing protein n=1 Tax=Reticulomyxa filosa TaxID=46433 RepID=X6NVZ4_RETFI|nr:hypothetical protein RFI_07062 [Reticulomyxa filosa]|eukprot:ETO30058.1 hypothetical protein RFI_07062 [Reticulomyxa filosa]